MTEEIQSKKNQHPADGQQRVIIVGGGLAGLSAATALLGRGVSVDLIESRRQCGGRAASFEDSEDGSLVDACQHVAMGCCTNFLDLCQQTGLGRYLRRDRTLWFIGPDGSRSACTPAAWVPAPLHLVPLLFGMNHFSFLEKAALAWGMVRLAVRQKMSDGDTELTAAQWLRSRQPERVIQLFWQPVIESWLLSNAGSIITTEAILTEAVMKPIERQTKGDQMQVADVLRSLNYERKRVMVSGNRSWRWVRL